MNRAQMSLKIIASILLMLSITSVYAKKQILNPPIEEAVDAQTVEADVAMNAEAACRADQACDVASDFSEDNLYGGIQKEYVVKGCKVTIYNDGPIKMVNVKTDQPCNAPIPKDHQFSKTTRTYQEDGCTITEFMSADGIGEAMKDCSKKK